MLVLKAISKKKSHEFNESINGCLFGGEKHGQLFNLLSSAARNDFFPPSSHSLFLFAVEWKLAR